MNLDLFGNQEEPSTQTLEEGAVLLRRFACSIEDELLGAIEKISAAAPFRKMKTPGGHQMSVAMTNCGPAGWVTDKKGYRYSSTDPLTTKPWPSMPEIFSDLARRAAREAGFEGFEPDACLINRYEAGARMGLHQDRDEADLSAPIVSLSLGLPARFLLGGFTRSDGSQKVDLRHGDVFVFGGPSRLRYHGIAPLKGGQHRLTGPFRYNVTFREALHR